MLLPEKKNRGRWKRSVPVVAKGIICVLSQSPNGSKSSRGEHRRQAIGKRRQVVGKQLLKAGGKCIRGGLQPLGCGEADRDVSQQRCLPLTCFFVLIIIYLTCFFVLITIYRTCLFVTKVIWCVYAK